MKIHEKYLEDFKDIAKYLNKEEIEKEIKDYIDLTFAVRDENHFKEIYNAFLNLIN